MKANDVEEVDGDISQLTFNVKELQNQLYSYETEDPYRRLIDPNFAINELIHKGKDSQLSFSLQKYISENNGDDNQNKVTYELYYTQDQQHNIEIAQLLELERRVSKLEDTIGIKNQDDLQHDGLINKVLNFDKTISCLNDQTLSYLSQKIQQLTYDLEVYSKTKENLSLQVQSEYGKKIEKLYESSEIIDQVSNQLPLVVDRLIHLQAIHEENTNFTQNVQTLFNEQERIKSRLSEQKEFLSKVENNLNENIETIKSNIEILGKKFDLIEGNK